MTGPVITLAGVMGTGKRMSGKGKSIMFGFFKKKGVKSLEQIHKELLFTEQLAAFREKAGFERCELPIENLITFFAANLADLVAQQAKQSAHPECDSDPSEKIATLLIFAQASFMCLREINNQDEAIKTIIMDNGTALLLQIDKNHPTPQALEQMTQSITLYKSLSADRLDILKHIDAKAYAFLLLQSQDSMDALVQTWGEIVTYIRGGQ